MCFGVVNFTRGPIVLCGECWADLELDEILTIAVMTRGRVQALLDLVALVERIVSSGAVQGSVGLRIWKKGIAELNLYKAAQDYGISGEIKRRTLSRQRRNRNNS